jgi:hypothetical protein
MSRPEGFPLAPTTESNLASTEILIPIDVIKHHISRYNMNINARLVCRAWRDAFSVPSNRWLSLASPSIAQCTDRLSLALHSIKLDFRGPVASYDGHFVEQVLAPRHSLSEPELYQ